MIDQIANLSIMPRENDNVPSAAEVINQRLQALEMAILPKFTEEDTTEPIYRDTNFDTNELKQVYDLDRLIPTFNGDPSELYQFLHITENLVDRFKPKDASDVVKGNQLHTLCMIIRQKIQGEANSALVNNFVNLNFNCIKRTLITYFGEKRDLTTLDHQLMNCSQNNRTLEEFYDDINRYMSHITNNIRTDKLYAHAEAAKALISHYNSKALDAFIRGLDGDTGKFLKCYNPTSIAAAYAYCVEIQNMDYRRINIRRTPENTNNPRNAIPIRHTPKIPPRPQPRIPPSFFNPKPFFPKYYPSLQTVPPMLPPRQPIFQNYYPKLSFQPQPQPTPQQWYQRPLQQPFQQLSQTNNTFPQRLIAPPKLVLNQQMQRPIYTRNPFQPRPEPMEVDNSIKTKQVNYQNRPNEGPNKRPRVFNIETNEPEETQEEHEEATPTEEEYLEEYELLNQEEVSEDDHAEFNFLG